MRYRLLGPLTVDVAGQPVRIAAARDRVLLAMLLLQPNRVVTVARLVDAVWGDAAPATARAQLHTCVSRLRRLLPDLIRTDTAGYRAAVADDDLDTLTFTALVTAGRAAAAAGDLHTAHTRLRAALRLWRGPALAGLDSPPVQAHAVALEERRDAAVEDCIDVELRLGRHAELIGQLTALVEQHPLRERLTGQLMTALTRAGRTADALAVYRRLRKALHDELGLPPGDALQRLHHDLLQPAAEPAPTTPAPAAPQRVTRPWTLPRDVADYSGREHLLTDLITAVADDDPHPGGVPAVLTVDGMAGVGKTSLAVHLAHRVAARYPDGRLFLDLHAHSDRPPLPPHEALAVLLGHLGVPPARIPADPDERVARWRSELADRRVLVVLDNAADAGQVLPLLPGSSPSLIIVTSRRRIAGLDGARPVSLDVLSAVESRRLITAVVGARAAADPAATAEVARLCGHLPLALRLAAARLAHRPSWSVADLADRLRSAHPAAVDLAVDGRSPHAAFDLSYRQLPAPAQRLFRLLGVHPAGDLSTRAAAALAGLPTDDTDLLLGQLVDSHLLNEPVAGRFRLHDLLREYATHLLDEPAGGDPDREPATRRLLDFYLHATAAATKVWESNRDRDPVDFTDVGEHVPTFTDMIDTRRWLDLEWANVVAVAHLADRLGWHRHTVLLPRALWGYLFRNSMNDVSLDLHRRALTAAHALHDPDLIAMTHNYLASAHARGGDLASAAAHLARLVTHPTWGVRARTNLAYVYLNVGRYDEALHLMEQSLITGADGWHVSVQWTALAGMLRAVGRYTESALVAQRIVAYGRRTGNPWPAAVGAVELGQARARLGRHRQAALLLRWARRQLGGDVGPAAELEARSHLGAALLTLGAHERGLHLLRTAYEDGQQLDPTVACQAGNLYGEALTTVGRAADAKLVHAQVLDRAMRIGHRYEQARAYRGLGVTTDDPRLARERLRTALELFDAMGTPERHEVRTLLHRPEQ
ncbi:winged helix-turn-helix domain-containing protein [Dactylosporangium aurantiacum]|uniref:Winged helix-turn-helix domain-containing protein n=1 Tax=Dactylosporangium aurantiacum TaxID=35754 RepID=A0A9Q9I9M7_9ACTN|nr:BTAD domain-containing putative transcriptional regulator [Dactylosporangium aurantiacum]MDG6106552.1 BTAD domain-containing putative transcriptional regulator [Dactylosporangium aurantiacum]UWZ50420.1 winged helix-turn-helix domain-containing protein [Dactylosporangium aurantiacum]